MKRGFIFSFDSFLALVMFALFLILIFLFYIFTSPTTQQYFFSEDMLNVLSNVKINELDINSYAQINALINDAEIKDTSAPILEAIISLQAEAKIVQACDLFKNIRGKVEPPGYKIGLDLTNTQVCADESVSGVNIISRGRTATGKTQA